jgi:pectate disaccharide-lyase
MPVIDAIGAGITPWMYRLGLRLLLSALMMGSLAACGGEPGEPTQGWPSDGGTGNSAPGGSTSQAGQPAGFAGSGAPVAGGTSGNPTGSAGSTPGVGGSSGGAGSVAGSSATGGAGNAGSGAGGAPSQTDIWVATDGADTNNGTEQSPLKTIALAITRTKPGSKIWVKPGTYASTATIDIIFKYSGTAAQPITLQAAPGGRPLLDFTGQTVGNDDARGINLLANYWRIKGLELKKSGDNCIGIAGSNNVIEDVIAHECGDTGIQITAPSSQATDQTRAANNTILNCDSWGNLDSATGGENADGFAAKLRIGPGNVFRGCRAWNNADDGWDLFAADDVVKIENSWAFSNGKPLGGSNPQGDGNGFKLGGEPNGEGQGGAVHLVSGSFAFENKACGFVRNNNPETPKLTACGAKDNKTAYCNLSVSGEASMSMTSSAARTAARNADGSLPAMK